MRDGTIFAHGSAAEIVTPGLLSSLYEMDIPVGEAGGRRPALYFP